MERKKFYRSVWFWVVIVVLLALTLSSLFRGGSEYQEVPTSVALEQLREGNVESVTINDREQTVHLDLAQGAEHLAHRLGGGVPDDERRMASSSDMKS